MKHRLIQWFIRLIRKDMNEYVERSDEKELIYENVMEKQKKRI